MSFGPRQRRLARLLAKQTDNSNNGMERLIRTLMKEDYLMAELMGCCARDGENTETDSTLDFSPGGDGVPDMWFFGGYNDGSLITYHLPEPHAPGDEPPQTDRKD